MHYKSVCTSLLVALAVLGVNAIRPQDSQDIVAIQGKKPHSAQDLAFNQFLATPDEESDYNQVKLAEKDENENEPDENEVDENEVDENEVDENEGKETAAAVPAKSSSVEENGKSVKGSSTLAAPLSTTAAAATMISSPVNAKPTPSSAAAPAVSIAPISLESLSFPSPPKASVSGKPNAAAATGAASRGLAHRRKSSTGNTLYPTFSLTVMMMMMMIARF
ncbi:hypothetical protein BC941DRAFT_447552 [Chlamydoabsidia padenii]|nr:hypothetical protein BC941DRAFT_447552 [Chlamydoabsidia padenii]